MRGHPTRRYRLGLFGSIYMVQGIAFAFFRNYHKPYLSNRGISPDLIATLSFFLFLPFITKVLMGIISDRFSLFGLGHRKPYLVLGLVVTALSLTATAFFPAERYLFLFALFTTLASFGVNLFDVVTDGLAIELTPPDERGILQGVMVGGRGIVYILFSLLFGWLISWRGGMVVFIIIGICMLFPLLWVHRLTATPKTKVPFSWTAFKELGTPHRALFALYAVIGAIGVFGTDGIATYFLRTRFECSDIAIGRYGALRGIGAIFGALLGAGLIPRIGRVRVAYATTVLISAAIVVFSLARSTEDVLLVALFWGVVWALGEVLFAVLAMDITDPRIAAATFAVMVTLSNLAGGLSESVATALSDDIGFDLLFWGLAAINLTAIPILYCLFRAMSTVPSDERKPWLFP